MAMFIEDGKGSGRQAGVSHDNRLDVAGKNNPRYYYVARDDGEAFMLTSTVEVAAHSEYLMYIKNTHATKHIVVDRIVVGGVLTALWKFWFVEGTAGAKDTGSLVAPTNTRTSSGVLAQAVARVDTGITGLTTTDNMWGLMRTGANMSGAMEPHDSIQIGPGDAFAVELDTGAGDAVNLMCNFFYD